MGAISQRCSEVQSYEADRTVASGAQWKHGEVCVRHRRRCSSAGGGSDSHEIQVGEVGSALALRQSDSEAWKLSRTKAFSTTITMIGIGTSVQFGSPFGSVLIAAVATLVCRLSDLLSMPEVKLKDKMIFLALSVGSQVGGFVLFIAVIVNAEKGL